jgi:hypothetical protein
MSSLERLRNTIGNNKYWASNKMTRIKPIVMALDAFFSENCPSYNNCRIKLTRNCPPLELLELFPENVTFADIYEYMKNDSFNRIDLTKEDGFQDTDVWFVNAFQTTFSDYTIPLWQIDMTLGEWLEHMRDDDVCDCFDALNKLLNNLESSMMKHRFFYNRDFEKKAYEDVLLNKLSREDTRTGQRVHESLGPEVIKSVKMFGGKRKRKSKSKRRKSYRRRKSRKCKK